MISNREKQQELLSQYPLIKSLAVISDRHSCALLSEDGTINWYCPGRFDHSALLSSLIDAQAGGYWAVNADGKSFQSRQFQNRSSVLKTYYSIEGMGFTLTDFMPLHVGWSGICRMFSKAPFPILNTLKLKPEYGVESEGYVLKSPTRIHLSKSNLWLSTSHPMLIEGDIISFTIQAGEEGWAILSNNENTDSAMLDTALKETLENWEKVESLVNYHGPFENEVRNSLRALQQMVYEPTGGIMAAATTSLPEVIGGERNYDYRYVWMRDAALITSSLTQIITTGELEQKFIAFIAGAMRKNNEDHVSCFYGIDQKKKVEAWELPLTGYMDSSPVMVGNTAAEQYQLDSEGNILIACSIIYAKFGELHEWDTVEQIADYICENWERKDNGIWEEEQVQHYTTSKAFAARGLELIAPYQKDKVKAEKWLKNAKLIREYIREHCMTSRGAYAVHAGSEDVDVTTALFAPFGFDDPNSEAMLATVEALEERYAEKNLYRRHLLEFDSSEEGAFLAGTCWMAHYYALAGKVDKSRDILEAVLRFSNDLGYFSEEADNQTGEFLGNFPQTFVHSSFICAVNGYKLALEGIDSSI